MPEKISKENEALQPGTLNPLETHSIDTEQIKVQDSIKAIEKKIEGPAIEEKNKEEVEKNPLETYSIDTEQIKAQEKINSPTSLETTEKEVDVNVGTDIKKEEKKEWPQVESVESVGHVRTPEETAEYKKIMEGIERNRQKRKETEDKEKELREKQSKGDLLEAKEVAFLRAQQYHQEEQKEIKSEKKELPQIEVLNPFRTYSVDTEQIKAQEQKEEGTLEKGSLETYSVDTEKIKAQEVKERAEKDFPQILKGINEAREKGQKEAENSFYAVAPEVYKEATGEDLNPAVDEMVSNNLKETGMKIIKIKDYLSPERVKKTEEEVKREERSSAILKNWEALPSKEKEKYAQNGAINSEKFVNDLSARKKALAEKEGVSEAVFNRMTNEGLDVKSLKKRGFFGQMFGGAAVEVPTLDGSGVLSFSSKKKFKEYLGKKESDAKDFAEKETKRRMDRKIIEGQARLRNEKHKCIRKIFQETIEKKEQAIKIAEEQKVEAERTEEERRAKMEQEKAVPKIEIVSRIGRERTPEQMREIEKIRKQVEIDIKRRKESQERIKNLIKKQKKGGLLTSGEVTYLRAIELDQKKKKELLKEKESKKAA
jgi:hypothetical protein